MAQVLDIGDDLSLPKDTYLYEKKIDEKMAAKCFYDAVMGAFVTRLYKPDNLDTGIGLRMRAMHLIMVRFPRLGAVVERYANRDMYTSYKFQIADIFFLTLGKKIIIIQVFTFFIV